MSEAGGQAPSPNIAALVEALDARAKQAGIEGATTVLRGMVASVSETMTSIEDRLERVETHLGERASDTSLADAVQSALASFNARLGRLEEAFVQAVEESGSGTDAVVDQIREAVVASLASVESAPPSELPPSPPPVDLGPLHERLERIEGSVRALVEAPPPPVPEPPLPPRPVDLGPLHERLARIEGTVRRLADAPPPPEPAPAPPGVDLGRAFAPVVDQLGRVHALVRSLETQVQAMADAPPAAPPPPVDLAPVVERLERVEGSVRALVDAPPPPPPREPPPVDLAPVVERVEHVAEAVRDLAHRPDPPPPVDLAPIIERLERLATRDRALVDDVFERLEGVTNDRLVAVYRAVGERSELLRREIAALATSDTAAHPVAAAPADLDLDLDLEPVLAAVRREAELLTQRVAALAVGVEATRALLEQHVADTEASLGRKATEVGRKLAADLGLRPRRGGPRRDRELGPG